MQETYKLEFKSFSDADDVSNYLKDAGKCFLWEQINEDKYNIYVKLGKQEVDVILRFEYNLCTPIINKCKAFLAPVAE